ncbi:MAG: methyltransferase [Paracoccaceae bacterium]|nr:methyltransferase [Paracoccaceae bacterium]
MTGADRLGLPFRDGRLHLPEGYPIVAWNGRLRPFYRWLGPERLNLVQDDRTRYDQLVAEGFRVRTATEETAFLAVAELDRSRQRTLGLIGAAYSRLRPGGTLMIDGDRGEGIDGILKTVRSIHPVDGCLSKAHGRVLWLTRRESGSSAFDAWQQQLVPSPNAAGFQSVPGLFSADDVDPGSALLARNLPPLRGTGIDLGAGWGWLSHHALTGNPEIHRLTLVDSRHAAIECARMNIKDGRVRFAWADALAYAGEGEVDFVLMNPPFHMTRRPDPGLGRAFIRRAATLLNPNGTLHLVGNRRLAYESSLGACFRSFRTVSEAGGYKVIRATRPRPGP